MDILIRYLPVSFLVIQVIIDLCIIEKGAKVKRFDFSSLVFWGGFIVWAFFLYYGIDQTIQFLQKSEIEKTFASIFATIILSLGYYITKLLNYMLNKEERAKELRDNTAYQKFLHYFLYTSGSVVFLFISSFILAIISIRY